MIENKIKLNKTKKRELLSFDYKGFQIFVGRNNKENGKCVKFGNTGRTVGYKRKI